VQNFAAVSCAVSVLLQTDANATLKIIRLNKLNDTNMCITAAADDDDDNDDDDATGWRRTTR